MKVTTDKVRGVLDRFLEFMEAECESLTPTEQEAAHAVIADMCVTVVAVRINQTLVDQEHPESEAASTCEEKG